jgi:hypothetical protein
LEKDKALLKAEKGVTSTGFSRQKFEFYANQKIVKVDKKLILFALVMLASLTLPAQELIYKSGEANRTIRPGKGQEFDQPLTPIDKFYFVQFGVYHESTVDPYEVKAPSGIGQVWLIHHEGTRILGSPGQGAFYIVQPFPTQEAARNAANSYKKRGLSCWYNPALTGQTFQLISTTTTLVGG